MKSKLFSRSSRTPAPRLGSVLSPTCPVPGAFCLSRSFPASAPPQLPAMCTRGDGSGLGKQRVLEPSQGFNPHETLPASLLRLTSPSSDSLHQNYSGWPVE